MVFHFTLEINTDSHGPVFVNKVCEPERKLFGNKERARVY